MFKFSPKSSATTASTASADPGAQSSGTLIRAAEDVVAPIVEKELSAPAVAPALPSGAETLRLRRSDEPDLLTEGSVRMGPFVVRRNPDGSVVIARLDSADAASIPKAKAGITRFQIASGTGESEYVIECLVFPVTWMEADGQEAGATDASEPARTENAENTGAPEAAAPTDPVERTST